ncbi:hypothetical protein BDF22DRAFT_741293 [Syncephalis plumigaleata]|nr:hypothetical protein BDF22DRAFT_741293 [Syncephalis plumigaleata]
MSKYVAKGAMRSVKNQLKGYTEMQTKVRSATSNDPWGASGALMAEIAQATYDPQMFVEIMAIIDKRLNDHEQVVRYAKENLYIVKTLREFQHIDDHGRDQGANVRQKAKLITALLNDEERLAQERKQRDYMQTRMGGYGQDEMDAAGSSGTRSGTRHRPIERSHKESKRTAAQELKSRRRSEEDLQQALLISEREEREKQEMIAAQNELILTDDYNNQSRNPWQQRGISSSAMELFGGSLDEQPLSTPTQSYPMGQESHYTYVNNTTTMGQNNPFGPSGHSIVQQQHHQQGPPLSIEAQSQVRALQAPGYGMDAYGNSTTGPGYAASEYGGSTISSNLDSSYTGGMTSSLITPVSHSTGALVPYGAGPSNALVTTNNNNNSNSSNMMAGNSASNPFFSGNSNNSNNYNTYNGASAGMSTMGTMNMMNSPMSTMNGMGSAYGQSNYGAPSSSMSGGYGNGNNFSNFNTSSNINVGTLVDVGLPAGGQSFSPQTNKNPFQQQQNGNNFGGGTSQQGYNQSWM